MGNLKSGCTEKDYDHSHYGMDYNYLYCNKCQDTHTEKDFCEKCGTCIVTSSTRSRRYWLCNNCNDLTRLEVAERRLFQKVNGYYLRSKSHFKTKEQEITIDRLYSYVIELVKYSRGDLKRRLVDSLSDYLHGLQANDYSSDLILRLNQFLIENNFESSLPKQGD